MAEAKIDLSRKQILFIKTKKPLVYFRGGIRSGKTFVLCVKAILRALQKRKQLIISNDYPQSRDVILPTMKICLEMYGLVEDKDYTLNLTNLDFVIKGTYVHLRSAERANRLRGISCADVYIDETRNIKDRTIYDICLGRISDCEDGQMHLTSSPRGKDWAHAITDGNEDCELIIQKTIENPFLPKNYIETLRKSYTSKFARQELDAEIIAMGGEIINPAWFDTSDSVVPRGAVRYWDLAVSTTKAADNSAGALCSVQGAKFVIHDIRKYKMEYPELRRKIIQQAIHDGRNVPIYFEDAGQQRAIIDDIKTLKELSGYIIRANKPKGDKLARALPWACRAELGSVVVCKGPYMDDFFDECSCFSGDDSHQHDDQIDSVSGAYEVLTHKSTGYMSSLR
jgi:predicted phage terminase large subunit-like protein